jgi:geranylgeranyl reductase family protein
VTAATDTGGGTTYNRDWNLNKRPDFDVIVAGAGAGGAAAAYHLRQAGLSVLVVEKARLPRYKACGGAIPAPTLDRFPFPFGPVIRAAPAHVRFTFPGLPPVDRSMPDRPVVMVMRSQLDRLLLEHADAEVLEGVAVTGVIENGNQVQVEVGNRKLTARYLVGADGATSQVARCLGLRQNRRLGGALEAELPLSGNSALQDEYGDRAVFALGIIPWGYGWVFPKGDSLSVGIGQVRPGRGELRRALQREMNRLGIGLERARLHGHPLPCYRAPTWPLWSSGAVWFRNLLAAGGQPQERLSTRRCLLVGDAAGLVDPFIGEGIRYTIGSGRLAARAILRDDLSGYEAEIWQEIGHDLASAGQIANTYYRLPWLCYQIGVRNEATVGLLEATLTGKCSYKGIGRRLFAATVSWLLGAGPQATVDRSNP